MAPATKKAPAATTAKRARGKTAAKDTPLQSPAEDALHIEPTPTSPDVIIMDDPHFAKGDKGVTAEELAAINQMEFEKLMEEMGGPVRGVRGTSSDLTDADRAAGRQSLASATTDAEHMSADADRDATVSTTATETEPVAPSELSAPEPSATADTKQPVEVSTSEVTADDDADEEDSDDDSNTSDEEPPPTKPPPAQPRPTTAEVAFPEPVDVPRCSRCKTQMATAKVALVGKSMGAWRCATCNSRATQMNRVFGTIKPDCLRDLSTDELTEFLKSIGQTDGKASSVKAKVDAIIIRKTEQKRAESAGRYMPLGYYKTQGYDVHRLKKHCVDKKYTELTGWLYKVYVEGDSAATIDDRERTTEHGTRSAPQNGRYQGGAQTPKRARSESVDTSDVVDDKKRNKGKADKAETKQQKDKTKTKHAKDKAKDKARAAKESEKATNLNKKLAAKTICRTAALVISLRQIAKSKVLKDLPAFMTDTFNAAKDALEAIEKEARSICNTGADFSFEIVDIDRAISDAKSSEHSMKCFVATASMMMVKAEKGE